MWKNSYLLHICLKVQGNLLVSTFGFLSFGDLPASLCQLFLSKIGDFAGVGKSIIKPIFWLLTTTSVHCICLDVKILVLLLLLYGT